MYTHSRSLTHKHTLIHTHIHTHTTTQTVSRQWALRFDPCIFLCMCMMIWIFVSHCVYNHLNVYITLHTPYVYTNTLSLTHTNTYTHPPPSHRGPHFANLKIIWRDFSYVRMGTLELCPMWDIYGQPRNLSEDCGSRNICFIGRWIHNLSQMSHQMPHMGHFQWGI